MLDVCEPRETLGLKPELLLGLGARDRALKHSTTVGAAAGQGTGVPGRRFQRRQAMLQLGALTEGQPALQHGQCARGIAEDEAHLAHERAGDRHRVRRSDGLGVLHRLLEEGRRSLALTAQHE